MNRTSSWVASALLVLLALLIGTTQTKTIQDIQARKYLKCGVLNTYPRFNFLDEKGNYQGFDVEFCRAISAALGVEVRYTNLTGVTRFPAF